MDELIVQGEISSKIFTLRGKQVMIERKLGIKARDIFWLKVGKNIGQEVYGKGEEFLRPVIVIRQFTSDLFVGVPTTSTKKENNDYFHTITYKNRKSKTVSSIAMLLQFKTYSKKWLLS